MGKEIDFSEYVRRKNPQHPQERTESLLECVAVMVSEVFPGLDRTDAPASDGEWLVSFYDEGQQVAVTLRFTAEEGTD